jgi:hypothetical protein
MSRSGYSEDYDDQWALIRWRGAVTSSIRGKRGQAFLAEMRDALDAMPEKKLVAMELEVAGSVCAIGAVGKARGVDMSVIDPEDYSSVAGKFGIAEPLAQEIVYLNDEAGPWKETDEQRFARMRRWLDKTIIPTQSEETP